ANGFWFLDRVVPSGAATACAHTQEAVQSNGGVSDRAGYLPSCYQAQGAESFPVPAGMTVGGINQSLAAGGAVAGTLLNADGSPCAQCYVSAQPLSDPTATRQVSDGSDDSGGYLIRSIPAGSYAISFTAEPDENLYPTPVTVVAGQVLSGIDGRLT
ncbi:MAG: hypothetical protein JWM76_2768, partial [Pseudonocardiales bacterium]|nr:hypothetical protein [Pseudonocardiales bacterium]